MAATPGEDQKDLDTSSAQRPHRLSYCSFVTCVMLQFLHSHAALSTGHCDRRHAIGAASRPQLDGSDGARHRRAGAGQRRRHWVMYVFKYEESHKRGECGGVFCGQKTGLDILTPQDLNVGLQ